MEYLEELQKYGLSEKEAKVYLALLKKGPSTVNDIAEKADLVRTTTYDVLKKLKEEGIVGSMNYNKILYFEPATPEKLIQILDERKKHITSILKELKQLRKDIPEIPRSEIYEGKHGVKTVFQIILESKKPLYGYANYKAMIDFVKSYGPNFINTRAKRKIPIKIITESSKESSRDLKTKDKQQLRETRTIPELCNVNLNQYMNDEFVAILSSNIENPIGIIIYHKDFAKEQKIIFEKLWEIAKK
ncbi:ArsR family transcriptional regulator [archaeon]|nr:ArsR family transcriptional regulator [archaeon]